MLRNQTHPASPIAQRTSNLSARDCQWLRALTARLDQAVHAAASGRIPISQPTAPTAQDAPPPQNTESIGVETSRETARLFWRAYARRHLR
jgi:hypothetical protein